MPTRRLPTSFLVRRAMTINGTAYAVGDTVTAHNVRLGLAGKLSRYVNRKWLVPTPPLYDKTDRRLAQAKATEPYYLSPREMSQL